MHFRNRRIPAIHRTPFVRPGEDRALQVDDVRHAFSLELVGHRRRPKTHRAVDDHQRVDRSGQCDLRRFVQAFDESGILQMTDRVLLWRPGIKQ